MPSPSFIVNAGEHDRLQCPVSVSIPDAAALGSVRVLDKSTGASIPAQASADGTLTFIAERLAAGETRAYEVEEAPSVEQVQLEDDGGNVHVKIAGAPFTVFRYSKEHRRPHYYPVLGPQSKEVTETGPSDHVHHRSLYVAYGEVNGVDCWGEGRNSGSVVLKELRNAAGGSVYAEIDTAGVWQDKEGAPLMTDEIVWSFYNLPETRRIIESKIVFKATEGDVTFGDTKEAGIMCVRVAPSVKVSNTGKIENSFGGVNEAETWGKRANWCDYSGYVDGVHLGIAAFDHISNPRYPCHWHVRNYGLMGANIFGRGAFQKGGQLIDGDGTFTLKQGLSMTFRYQVVVHAGDARDADLAGAYHNFVNPPKAALSE